MAERISTSSGRVTGWLAIALAAFVFVLAVGEGAWFSPVAAGALLVAALAWAAALRPSLAVDDGRLEMRNTLQDVSVPLAAIERLAVRQVLAVRAGDRRYVCSAVGRSLRQAVKSSRPGQAPAAEDAGGRSSGKSMNEADMVEHRLHQLMEDARAAAGVTPYSDEQLALAEGVRRSPAWVPIVLVGLALAAFVATLLS